MYRLLQILDSILRGEATQTSTVRANQIQIPVGGITIVIMLLGNFYGVCMGLFVVSKPQGPSWLQLCATTVEVPTLSCSLCV